MGIEKREAERRESLKGELNRLKKTMKKSKRKS
jgi:hypothetical protein